MQIQISSDANIDRREALAARITSVVETALSHCADRISRVDVHVRDEHGVKKGHEDKRCTMEAHGEGLAPRVVMHHATTFDRAVSGAAEKLKRTLESTVDKLRHRA